MQDAERQADCIDVKDRRSGKKRTLCTMNMYMSDAAQNINRWKEMVLFFQQKCHFKLAAVPKDDELLFLKAQELENAVHESATAGNAFALPKLDNVLGEVTSMAVDAISKEIKYEAFAEKEEVEREDGQQKKDRLALEQNKEKLVGVV